MSKFHFLSAWLLVLVMFLAGCQSSSPLSGHGPGMTNGTKPGGIPGSSNTPEPFPPAIVKSNPDVQTHVNPGPYTPQPSRATLVPQSPLSQPDQTPQWDNTTGWNIYKDNTYHFRINYPPAFEIKALQAAELANLKPVPVSVTNFDRPAAPLGGAIPPAFSIRVYDMGASTSLEDWLKMNGLYFPDSGWIIKTYHGSHFSGYQVNSSLYMAPGWFIVAVQGDYLYQLIPLGNQSEAMLSTFEFIP